MSSQVMGGSSGGLKTSELRQLLQNSTTRSQAAQSVPSANSSGQGSLLAKLKSILPQRNKKQNIETAQPNLQSVATAADAEQAAGNVGSSRINLRASEGANYGLKSYAMGCLFFTIAGLALVWCGNRSYGPEMYGNGMDVAAQAMSQGLNYAVFDLNINIRRLRDQTVARMTSTPDVIIMGASHWQEAPASLIKNASAFNAHIHRDYWEDLLGMVGILESHNRLPKTLIISIRDKQFTPLAKRKDYLWEPGIPYYRAMADNLGLEKESFWQSLPYQRLKAHFSLSILFDNFLRWEKASERPHATKDRQFATLDTLLPDGSIVWSLKHQQLFTQQRSEHEANLFAASSINDPPQVDPQGLAAFDTLLTHLAEKGTKVYLVHPPFNPVFYDQVQGTAYMEGLKKIEEITQTLATKHGLQIFGNFNPHKVGCDASMYIDAEHSNAVCLAKVLDQFNQLYAQ